VAGRALLRQTRLRMGRVGRTVVVCLMTRDTGGGKACINIVLVTCCALHTRMRAGQRKQRRAVIEC